MNYDTDFWIFASEMETEFSHFPRTEALARALLTHPEIPDELREDCRLRLSGGPFRPKTFQSLAACRDILMRWPNIELKWLKFSGFEREVIVPDS